MSGDLLALIPVQQRAAIAALRDASPQQQDAATPALLSLLSSREPTVRWEAAALLHDRWSVRYPYAGFNSAFEALREGDEDRRLGMLRQLARRTERGQFDDADECDISAHLPAVCALLWHPSSEVQEQVLTTLSGAIAGRGRSEARDGAIPALMAFLSRSTPELQAQALRLLSEYHQVDRAAILDLFGGGAGIAAAPQVLGSQLIRMALAAGQQDVIAAALPGLSQDRFVEIVTALENARNTTFETPLAQALDACAASFDFDLRLRIHCLLASRLPSETDMLPAVVAQLLDGLEPGRTLTQRRRAISGLDNRAARIGGYMTARSRIDPAERVSRWDVLQPAVSRLKACLTDPDEKICTQSGRILRELLFDCDPEALADILRNCSDTAFSTLGADIEFESLTSPVLYDSLEARSLPAARERIAAFGPERTQVILGGSLGPKRPLMVLPPEIARLTGLTMLQLCRQQLRALPPEIGALTALHELDISSNSIRFLPQSIGDLSALRLFRARDCPLVALPDRFCDLPSLTHLDLSSAALEALPERLGHLVSLTSLRVWGPFRTLPESLCELSNLVQLEVLSPLQHLPHALTRLPLESLTLRGLEEVPAAVFELETLHSLDLSRCNLTEIPAALAALPHLTLLNLEGNAFTRYPDALLARHAEGLTLWPSPE